SIEGAGFHIDGLPVIDAEHPRIRQVPDVMYGRLEHGKLLGGPGCDADQLVVRQDRSVQKLENAMLGRLDGCDIAAQPRPRLASVGNILAEKPPVQPSIASGVSVSLGLYMLEYVLINFGKPVPYIVGSQSEQVDDHCVTRMGCQVLPISIFANVPLQPFACPQSQNPRLLHRYLTSGAVKPDAS